MVKSYSKIRAILAIRDSMSNYESTVLVPTISRRSMNALVRTFLAADRFAVVGASTNPTKFGNKVLRTYLWREKVVTPINPREEEIEGQKCVKSLSELADPQHVAVSIVTPPAVTLGVLEEAERLGVTRLWLQPGSEDDEVLSRAAELGLQLIHGEPCVLVELGYYAPGGLGSGGGGGKGVSTSTPSL